MKKDILIDEEGIVENVLILDNFLPKTYCDLLINTFNKHNELRLDSYVKGKDETDVEEVSYKKVCVSEIPNADFIQFITMIMNDCYDGYRDVLISKFDDEKCLLGLPDDDMYDVELPIIKKYEPDGNDHFGPHCDTYMRGWEETDTLKINRNYRFLNILFYLNDVDEGGETEFYFADKNVKVKPKAGRVVIFPPFWTHIHAGLRPISNSKYIMNGYLNHKFTDKEYLKLVLKTGNNISFSSLREADIDSFEEHF